MEFISIQSYKRANFRKYRRGFLCLRTSFIIAVVYIIWNITYNFFFESQVKGNQQDFCAFENKVPTGQIEGLLMKPNIIPSEWVFYDSTSQNVTDQRIFFHETSGHHELNLKQCCAVESAARNNPNRLVQLFLRPPQKCFHNFSKFSHLYNPPWLKVLSRYPNVMVVLLNQSRYFAGTPFEIWYRKGEWRTSKFEIGHLSDYIRILTLYKGGGMYLDLDILTIKEFKGEFLRNCLVYENAAMDTIGNSVMHLERGHKLTMELIQLLNKEYDPEAYVYHGPDAIAEVMNRVCNLVAGKPKSNMCNNVQLLSHRYFHPVAAMFSHMLYEDVGNRSNLNVLTEIKESFGLHLWNSLSRLQEPLNIYSNQIVAILAREHCPLTVNRVKDFKFV